MTLVRPKAETCEAWQYTGKDDGPLWVTLITRLDDKGLWLIRRSGKQLVEQGDWLVRNLDSRDPEWLTHDQMRKAYDEVVG